MAALEPLADQYVFGLDIGTRSIVGTVGYMDGVGFHVVAMEVLEHSSRAMLDGQVHDIQIVGDEIRIVKDRLEAKLEKKLSRVCIAAAGRVLKTLLVHSEDDHDPEEKVTQEDIYTLEHMAIEQAHRSMNEKKKNDQIQYYCVGYTAVKYYLNRFEMGNLEGHKASRIGVDLLATFLPEEVVDGLYAAVDHAGLEVENLTLEPIAAMNVAIPQQYRLLNIALVDVGAGTSDICITKDGSIIAYGMIPAAGDELTEVIAKNYLVDFAQAEKIKMASSGKKKIQFKDIMGMKQSVDPAEVLKVCEPVMEHITKEVADKIVELNGGKPVSAVFVVGGGGKIAKFTERLAKHLSLSKDRVAVRGKEVLTSVEFAVDNVVKDSLYVTPVGICVNYYNQKNNFIMVTVNGNRIKLYDNNKLCVIDAVMQSGYPNEKLFPRRGQAVEYTFNGERRLIRGVAGDPAKITKNGIETSLTSPIAKNDYIDIEESTVGGTTEIHLHELEEFKSNVSFIVNGTKILCPRYAYVNDELQSGDYIVRAGDNIVMEDYYTVEQLFSFLDIPLANVDVYVNHEHADSETKVYANFFVEYEDFYRDVKNYEEHEDDEEVKAKPDTSDNEEENTEPVEEASDKPQLLTIKVNGQPVLLRGRSSYTFVNILDFYPFDLSKMGGSELVLLLNGEKAEFTSPVHKNDSAEIYWKE